MGRMNFDTFEEENNEQGSVYRYSKSDLSHSNTKKSARKYNPVHASREHLEELMEQYRNYAKTLRDEGNIDAAKASIISADIAMYLISTDLDSSTV